MKLAALAESGLKEVGPRLALVGLLPNLALFTLLAGLWLAGAPERAPDATRLWAAVKDPAGGEALGAALALLLQAVLVQPLQLPLVRLLEGYWPAGPLGRRLAAWGTARQRRRRDQLQQATVHEGTEPPDAAALQRMQAAAAALVARYPAAARLMPTALGNALRAAEDRPATAYGLDGVVVWPRLYPLLPEPMRSLLGDARNQMDTTLRLSAVFVLAAIGSAWMLAGHPPWWPVPALCLLLAAVAYRAGVHAAIAYGQAVEVAFDLYRFALYPAMHLPLPDSPDAERRLNTELSAFLRQRVRPGYAYVHPPPGKGT